MHKKICIKSVFTALIFTLLMTAVPVYAAEVLPEDHADDTVSVNNAEEDLSRNEEDDSQDGRIVFNPAEFKTGGVALPGDHEVIMPDRYMSFSEIRRNLGKNDAQTDSTDFTPRSDLPSMYPGNTADEVKNILETKYPKPRNQGDFGCCWAFSVNTCAEFGRIAHGKADKSIDLSELYLAAGVYKNHKNPVVGDDEALGGIRSEGVSDNGLLSAGGNYLFAAQYISKGFGFINEEDLPYTKYITDPRFDANGNLNLDIDALKKKSVLQISDLYAANINTDNGRDIIKEAIMKNASAGIFFHGPESQDEIDLFYDWHTSSYYLPASYKGKANHMVSIVGWDDDFSKENFHADTKPEHNGAWLIRNSWGSEEEHFYSLLNYFWLSYESKDLDDYGFIYDIRDPVDYDRNYYYDTQIHDIASIAKGDHYMAANVFRTGENNNEKLKEIQIEVEIPLSYEINIYRNLRDISDPESGELVDEATVTGYTGLGGLFTIPLKKEVLLEKGSLYSVVVRSEKRSVCLEAGIPDYGLLDIDIEVGIKKNQSFYYDGGKWKDLKDYTEESNRENLGNFCIAAHTSYTDEKEMEVIFRDVSGKEVTLIYNTEYGTYKTEDGEYVLMLSDPEDGTVPSQKYQFTGKKITPSKKSYIIYKGILYEYKTDYSIGFKKNKKRGSATATVKWKKNSAPRKDGVKKSIMNFDVVERTVTEDILSFSVKNGKIKKLCVTADGVIMKPKKYDYSYITDTGGGYSFTFKNNYKGEVVKKL